MAATVPRPRAVCLGSLLLTVVVGGCSLVRPVETPTQTAADAQQLAAAGHHADAARAYEALATAGGGDRDELAMLAAEQWVAAGDLVAAKRDYAGVSADARSRLATSYALVGAEIAVAEGNGSQALRNLDAIAPPADPALAQNFWWLRGKGEFLVGRPVDGVRAWVERERFLSDPKALRANREALYAEVRRASEHGLPLRAPAKSDTVVQGWLQLGPVAAGLASAAPRAQAALADWRRRFPQHPASDVLGGAEPARVAVAGSGEWPDQIALLLPLSGRAESVGTAVRDGFLAAYLGVPAASRPRLKIYDVAAEPVANAYRRALADGARFVVGPLTKDEVAAVLPVDDARVPLLALNFLGDSGPLPVNVYEFALWPEDEARGVARRLVADGRMQGIAIVADGDWGNRVGTAFTQELQSLGGTVLEMPRFENSRADFSELIKRTLRVHGGKGEPVTHRADASFVFIAGNAAQTRLIVPQLKFHYAGDIPVYTTSESYDPGASANADLDGMEFPDMPWVVGTDAATVQLREGFRQAWPRRAQVDDRLYAFGFDAYGLVPALRGNGFAGGGEFPGLTGKLRLDAEHRVRRELDWVKLHDGVPEPL